MKLRYQMRGLGIGILVTALLMGVATKEGRPLTDAEIKAKAYELGMVDGDSIRLTDLKGSTPGPQGTLSPRETMSPQGTMSPQETLPPQETMSPQETFAPATDPALGSVTGDDGSGEAVTVIITRGATSYSVSVQLAEAGLIENASRFDNYLCNNGYDGKIRAGTYRIVPGTGEEQIAKAITGAR